MLQQFRGLTDAGSQRAVVNIDDPAGPSVAAAAARVPCITYGIDNAAADVRVVDLQLTLWRTTVSACARGGACMVPACVRG
jgi:UDP-N-acetylmuramate-alanine ligase